MSDKIEFVRLVGSERRVGDSLASVSRHWQAGKERFLFVSPHDDDAALGAGLMMQLANREEVPVFLLIVTDGSMGYCDEKDRETISQIRRAETFAAYQKLGVPEGHIVWMGFPDCQLPHYQGRRQIRSGDQAIIEGFTGLQNAFTYYLRQAAPTQVFVSTRSDLHPDHRIVHDELMISLFHAAGEIWPELGSPLPRVPHIHEFAVYCDFPSEPRLRIRTPQEMLDHKIDALSSFASQRQIGSLLKAVAGEGPIEYFRPLDLAMYRPSKYAIMFEEPSAFRSVH